jgi:hypothetical protein
LIIAGNFVAASKAGLFELSDAGKTPTQSAANKDEGAERKPVADDRTDAEPAVSGPAEDRVVTVSRIEYEKLVAECLSQESLIEGLQKENERLFHVMRDKDNDDKASKASFFDQQEHMNRELNRLRNLLGKADIVDINAAEGESSVGAVGVSNVPGLLMLRKSSDYLRAELDADATVRSLRERVAIAESNAGAREKELQVTIDKLRKENRELIESSARNKHTIMAEFIGHQNTLESRVTALLRDNSELKARLVWFAENQELLENSHTEVESLRSQVQSMRKLFAKKGVNSSQLDKMLTTNDEEQGECLLTDHCCLHYLIVFFRSPTRWSKRDKRSNSRIFCGQAKFSKSNRREENQVLLIKLT